MSNKSTSVNSGPKVDHSQRGTNVPNQPTVPKAPPQKPATVKKQK